MATHTLLDVAKLSGNDLAVGLIEESLSAVPEMQVFMSRIIPGTSYTAAVRTALPTTSFTAANEGVTPTKSTLEQRLTQCFILRNAVEIDLAVDIASQGMTVADLEALESAGAAESALRKVGSQIFTGTGTDKGFVGLKSLLPTSGSIIVNAGGSTAGTASSVYAVKFGIKDCHLVFGNNSTLNLSPFENQLLEDANGGKFAGRVAALTAWVGMQVGNANCIGRIYNVTADSTKTMSDSLGADLIAKFPTGYMPDAFFMSRRSAAQLAKSRTVTLNGGPGGAKPDGSVGTIGPMANFTQLYIQGIPVVVTDSIPDTDTINS